MKKKISVVSIFSLIISMIATGMFWLLLGEKMGFLYIPWLITGVISILFPMLAKYCRKRNGCIGSGFEIAAIILGFYNFYWVLSVATKWHTTIIYLLCVLVCVLYGVLFKHVRTKESIEKPAQKMSLSAPIIISLLACLCDVFLFVDALLYEETEYSMETWLPFFFFISIPLVLFSINRKKKNTIITISCFLTMILLLVILIMFAMEESMYDFSGEAVIAFFVLMLLTFANFVFSVIALFKAKWNFGFLYNSIRYREKCYKRVEKMKRYLDSGIITEEEFEENKREILKHIQ